MGAANQRYLARALCAGLISTVLTGCQASRHEGGLPARADDAPILLFNGTGASAGDVAALRQILSSNHLRYATAGSQDLNAMNESRLRRFRLLIVPGGNFEQIGRNLASHTAANIHSAVENGLNYLGICAGAFFAGNSPYNGLNLTSGVRFGFYAAEARGIRKASVAISTAAGPTLDQYWEDGPQLTGWGLVAAKYPDGAAAVAEGSLGDGWVILTGTHPEAPATWRGGMDFRTPVAIDNAYATTLIRAALNRELLPHF
jgi:glutamine amidotransferase-like uncharacterized protein